MEPELYRRQIGSPAESPALTPCGGGDKLLPAAAIPLVYYTRELGICEQMRLPDQDSLAISARSTTLPSRR